MTALRVTDQMVVCITDGGRSLSQRRWPRNDCGPRALALATGVSYDECAEALTEDGGFACTRRGGTYMEQFFHALHWNETTFHGWRFEWISFPATAGMRRMNAYKFCDEYNSGRYILNMARHVVAVVDGVIYDTFHPRPDACVYGAWKLIKEEL